MSKVVIVIVFVIVVVVILRKVIVINPIDFEWTLNENLQSILLVNAKRYVRVNSMFQHMGISFLVLIQDTRLGWIVHER